MKKILLTALFLLTLLPLFRVGDAATASAQNWTYENGSWWLPDIEVKGNHVRCENCGFYYDPDNPADHECKKTCEYCFETVLMEAYEDHLRKMHPNLDTGNGNEEDEDPTGGSRCPFCNSPYGTCSCGDITINGEGNTAGNTHITITGGNTSESTQWSKPPEDSSDNKADNSGPDKDPPRVGGYYKPRSDCETLFKDSVLIPPLQPENTTCVSTALAYSKMWLEGLTNEQFYAAKYNIEELFRKTYKRKLSEEGVTDSILQKFIQYYSEINAQPVSLSELKTKLSEGRSGLSTLVIRKQDGSIVGHEIAIIGYDSCENKFICKDPQKMEMQKYSDQELLRFNSDRKGQNSIFYIETDFYKKNIIKWKKEN